MNTPPLTTAAYKMPSKPSYAQSKLAHQHHPRTYREENKIQNVPQRREGGGQQRASGGERGEGAESGED
jgi:hypothetical protein